jgi:large subunit ribosomal protein L33
MAKKGNRIKIFLECSKCKRQNYTTEKNKVNMGNTKLELKKFCSMCVAKTVHKEAKVKKGKSKKNIR